MYDVEITSKKVVQVADIRKSNDYAMWLLILRYATCYLLSEELALYRKRNGSISNCHYLQLIKWHYKLYREVLNETMMFAYFNTIRNLFFDLVKKIFYVK